MRFSRESSIIINFFLNELLPPIFRDSRLFMWPMMKLAFKSKTNIFFDFRRNLHRMTDAEYMQAYLDTDSSNLLKGSDLNQKCKDEIPNNIVGNTVLDVGCGRGELLTLLNKYNVFGCDLNPQSKGHNNIVCSFAEQLPFADNSFDTVVCTHVLEHVRNLQYVMKELRRVCSSRIIIVVPRERPYRFGFNLHITFFPYEYSLYNLLGANIQPDSISVRNLGGDWLYIEDISPG